MAQIGTIKIETDTHGIVSVPIFQTGDSGSSVYESVRVDTGSEVGFIPTVDPADATYDYFRFDTSQHNVVAVHDRSSLATDNVISFDKSGSMANNNVFSPAKTDAKSMLDNLSSDYEFGLVSWSGSGTLTLDAELRTSHSDIKTAIDGLTSDGQTSPTQGIRGADEILSGDDESSQISPTETGDADQPHVQVIFTDAGSSVDDGDTAETDAANNAKSKGQEIMVAEYNGVSGNWDSIVSDSAYLWDASNTTDVGQKIATEIQNL